MNTWQSGSDEALARNRAALEGMTAYLLVRGGRVGLLLHRTTSGSRSSARVPVDSHARRAAAAGWPARPPLAEARSNCRECRRWCPAAGHADPVRAATAWTATTPAAEPPGARTGAGAGCPERSAMSVSDDGAPAPRPHASAAGRRHRRRAGGHLRRRRADPAGRRPGRRRPHRPAAHAVRPGPARHRAGPPEDARHPRHPAPHASTSRCVRFVGNVEIGVDIALDELREHVDAVDLHLRRRPRPAPRHPRRGAPRQPGRHRRSSPGTPATPTPTADRVEAGAGRGPLGRRRRRRQRRPRRGPRARPRTAAELESTDMPQHVLDALAAAPVEAGHRAGPPRPGAGRPSPPRSCASSTSWPAPPCSSTPPTSSSTRRAEERAAADRERQPQPRGAARLGRPRARGRTASTLTLRFFRRPVRLLGEDRVTGVEVERTAVDGDGRAVGTGELEVLPADLVVRSVGYRGTPLPGLPVDERVGHGAARRPGGCCATARSSAGEYVAGWIKRGPSGVVGTNKHDARETVAALLADVAEGALAAGGAGRRPGAGAASPAGPSRCCSTTGGPSTPPRSRWAPAAAGPGRRCTSARPCWPPSAPPLPGRADPRGACCGARTHPAARGWAPQIAVGGRRSNRVSRCCAARSRCR